MEEKSANIRQHFPDYQRSSKKIWGCTLGSVKVEVAVYSWSVELVRAGLLCASGILFNRYPKSSRNFWAAVKKRGRGIVDPSPTPKVGRKWGGGPPAQKTRREKERTPQSVGFKLLLVGTWSLKKKIFFFLWGEEHEDSHSQPRYYRLYTSWPAGLESNIFVIPSQSLLFFSFSLLFLSLLFTHFFSSESSSSSISSPPFLGLLLSWRMLISSTSLE